VCTAYRTPTGETTDFPADAADFGAIEPVYITLPGWRADTTRCRTFDALPEQARGYLRFIERFVGAPVTVVSVGPGEAQTIMRGVCL